MKPKLHAEPSCSIKESDRKSDGPAKDEDLGNQPLSQMADTVREIYIRERTKFEQAIHHRQGVFTVPKDWDGRAASQLDGQEVKKGKRSVWEDLVDFMMRYRVDPHAYIAAIFGDLGLTERIPSPMVLYGPRAQDRWDRIKKGCERGIELAVRLETETAVGQMQFYQKVMRYGPKRACRMTLTDDTLELSPLLRYCVAYDTHHDDIAEHFFSAAVMQFCRYEEFYLKHWRLLLPKRFERQASDEYARLTGRLYG